MYTSLVVYRLVHAPVTMCHVNIVARESWVRLPARESTLVMSFCSRVKVEEIMKNNQSGDVLVSMYGFNVVIGMFYVELPLPPSISTSFSDHISERSHVSSAQTASSINKLHGLQQ